MKRITAAAAIALLALSVPAYAQSAAPQTATTQAAPPPGSPAATHGTALPPPGVQGTVAPAAPQSGPPAMTTVLQGADRDAALAHVNGVLNAVTRLQGRFVQIASDGSRSTGAFYLQRPGKLRFDYDPPVGLLIVSDGVTVAKRDRDLRTTDRTLLRATPLNLVLRSRVDLSHDARITRVARAGDWTLVTARDRSGHTEGEITMQFQGDQLRAWELSDASGARTRIALIGVSQPASIDAHMFRLEDIVENRPGPH